MAAPSRRRRGHAAASARILTAGLSSAAAFGMVAGMALATAADDDGTVSSPAVPAGFDQEPVTTAVAAAPHEVIVVVRRHWPSAPIAVTAASPAPAPLRATATAPAVQAAAPGPVARPITRTRSS